MEAENWPKDEFDGYEDMIRWCEARESRRTAETVDGIVRSARVYGCLAGYLVLIFLVARGIEDVVGGSSLRL
jgi:hypothetical protein